MSGKQLQNIRFNTLTGFFLLIFFFFTSFVQAQDSTKIKEEFKPSGKVWGYTFGDYAFKTHGDSAKRGNLQYSRLDKNYQSFNIRRVYLGYDYQFAPNVSSQIILAHESSFEAEPTGGNVLPDKYRGVYIKAMNIRFNDIIPRATIVAGQQSTTTFSTFSEGYWGYRSIEKTIADMRSISSSTDLGVGVFGKIGEEENLGYDVLIGNSNGAKFETDKFKKIYTSLYALFLDKKLVVQGNFEHDRKELEPLRRDISTFKVFVGYKTSKTTIGIDAFKQLQTNQSAFTRGIAPSVDTVFADAEVEGISLFVNREISGDKLRAFARFDIYNPDADFTNSRNYVSGYNTNKEYFATVGLDFSPYKNVHIMPNIWFNQYNNKRSDVGGSLKKDHDLVGRITLYYTFNK
ncbi:MAG: hypothetical protein ABIN48_05165 [Ginsengibacter sp.]